MRAELLTPPSHPAMRPTPAPAAPTLARVLLASDGTELSGRAARVALAVAQRHGAPLQVVYVMDTRGTPIPPPLDQAIALADELIGPEVHREQENRVRATLAPAIGEPVDWPVRVAVGAPASGIAREAARVGASLVVLGLRRHGPAGRALQDETALHVMRGAPCPVLAVTAPLDGLPGRVLVAVDFGATSRAAARLARTLVAPGGTLTLAYVPPALAAAADEGEAHVHALGVAAAFDALAAELAAELAAGDDDGDAAVRITRLVLDAPPRRPVAEQLADAARRVGAQLVALGSHRAGRVERMLLGSVTTELAREGGVSLLVVPPTRE